MIKIILIALLVSAAMIVAILFAASINPIPVYNQYVTLLMVTDPPRLITVTEDRVCYLYVHDIRYNLPAITSIPDLYYINISESYLDTRFGAPVGVFNVTSNVRFPMKIIEIDRSVRIDIETMIRERLRTSNYSLYLPIIPGKEYKDIVDYAEQAASQISTCNLTPPVIPAQNFVITPWFSGRCQTLATPSIGNALIVDVCLDRALRMAGYGLSGNATRIDEILDMVANASIRSISNYTLKILTAAAEMNIFLEYSIEYTILLQPKHTHIARGLAFLVIFSSGLILHYRFRPEEYTGLIRFFRVLRRKIYGL